MQPSKSLLIYNNKYIEMVQSSFRGEFMIRNANFPVDKCKLGSIKLILMHLEE